MDLQLAGRTALVCASTAGLGLAAARAIAAEGARLVICGRRGELARTVASELPIAVGVEVDLTAPGGPEALLNAATAEFGSIDVLVLNGPGPKPSDAAGITPNDAQQAVLTLFGVQQRLVSLVLPGMRERGWGRILAIGSSGVAAPLPGLALSNLGRAALASYLKTLAAEVAADGVTVNLLLPGRIATDRVAALDAAAAQRTSRSIEAVRTASADAIPAGRYGDPAEFGAIAAFLVSGQASYLTGTAVRCDGGLVPVL